MSLTSTNPATGQVLSTFDELTPEQLESKVACAAAAFSTWRRTSFAERSAVLRRAAEILHADKEKLARLAALEMGKTRKSAIAEVEKCALGCRFYAEHASAFLAEERLHTEFWSAIRYYPLGVVLAIMPWNFPYWQVFRFLAPAMMAGNVALLKHASNVPQCAMAIEDVMHRAGLPDNVFQTLLIGSSRIGQVLSDPRIAAVTLTGSEKAGAQVGSAAGHSLKKVVLELGGSDPFVVMPTADLAKAVRCGVVARMENNGESCICAKRFIVHKDVYDKFERGFVAAVQELKPGDPMLDDTDVGPLASAGGVAEIAQQVDDSVKAGAKLLTGGRRLDCPGNYYAPTVLADIPRQARVYREEVFGPVAMLYKVQNLDEAIALANDTPFGLASSAWTNDPVEQQRFANELEAGQTFINAVPVSDPRMPFGGIKMSGYGRELGSLGIREFTNIKTIVIT